VSALDTSNEEERMRVIICKDEARMGEIGAGLIAELLRAKTHAKLGLATGTTPLPVYRELIRLHKEEELDFGTTITFNLDEYVGLDGTHPQSYRRFMDRELFDHVNINKKATHVPDGMADDVEAFCELYEAMIDDVGGIDLQVLGIGSNGHIGFNEPGTSFGSRTHRTRLAQSTIDDNSRLFERKEDVPTEAITMGIGTILDADRILLFATGANKAEAIRKSIEGPLTASVPAAALQLHPAATWIVTEDATTGLALPWERV
jgi:glucosamine-6-phosphate deaminase